MSLTPPPVLDNNIATAVVELSKGLTTEITGLIARGGASADDLRELQSQLDIRTSAITDVLSPGA